MRVAVCLVAALIAAGCGAGRSAVNVAPPAITPASAPPESLSAYIRKARELSVRATARPPQYLGTTLESFDPELGAALAYAGAFPSAEAYRRVAAGYARRNVFDKAHEYLMTAVRLDSADPETYDALARLWRDARMPQLALPDAYRAVYYGADWAVAHNTLGTVFQALGRRAQARVEYEKALALDANAAYALNNLCYDSMLAGRYTPAITSCRRALAIDPSLAPARNNLALAQAASGDLRGARESFAMAADQAGALYNVGVANLARREFNSAVEAFEAAQTLRPVFPLAAARARQARQHAGEGESE